MTKTERINLINAPYIGYISALGGIEIKTVDWDENRVAFVAGAWNGERSAHTAKIRYLPSGREYFVFLGYRFYLDEQIVD